MNFQTKINIQVQVVMLKAERKLSCQYKLGKFFRDEKFPIGMFRSRTHYFPKSLIKITLR